MRIAIIGYGKMGKQVEELALKAGHNIVSIIKDSPSLDSFLNSGQKADVAIEFSSPESGKRNVRRCIEAGFPVVSGTTGWQDQLNEVEVLVKEKEGTFFFAPNFSIGMNLVFKLAVFLGKAQDRFPSYIPELSEAHHLHKKDEPSGTAIKLAEEFLKNTNRIDAWELQSSKPSQVLNVQARREGEVIGEHTLRLSSDLESLSISHVAKDRSVFADGALKAAHFIQGKKGCFYMDDLLGL